MYTHLFFIQNVSFSCKNVSIPSRLFASVIIACAFCYCKMYYEAHELSMKVYDLNHAILPFCRFVKNEQKVNERRKALEAQEEKFLTSKLNL